jgi:hypothetical protein
MPTMELEFEVFCASCGNGLCNVSETGTTQRRAMPFVSVEPCPKCIEKAADEGYEKGADEGYKKGYAQAEKDAEAKN